MSFWAIVGAVVLGGVLLYLLPLILVVLTGIGALVVRLIFSRIMLVAAVCLTLFWLLLRALGSL